MTLVNSLHVMTSLAEKEGLKGKVQMIYIDPPYGIRFGSNWQISTRKHDVKDGRIDNLHDPLDGGVELKPGLTLIGLAEAQRPQLDASEPLARPAERLRST